MKPGDPTMPLDGAKADGLTNVGAEDIPELPCVKPVPCTKTVGGGEDVGDIEGERDPEWCLTL